MKKSRMAVLLALLVALTVVPMAVAGPGPTYRTPSGAAPVVRAAPGQPIDFNGLNIPSHVYMVDVYDFCWDLDVSIANRQAVFSGTVDTGTGWLWDASGTLSPGTTWTSHFRADNPYADNCYSGYTDYFVYDGTGKRSQSGGWTSYCGGSVAGTGSWSGTFYVGYCD